MNDHWSQKAMQQYSSGAIHICMFIHIYELRVFGVLRRSITRWKYVAATFINNLGNLSSQTYSGFFFLYTYESVFACYNCFIGCILNNETLTDRWWHGRGWWREVEGEGPLINQNISFALLSSIEQILTATQRTFFFFIVQKFKQFFEKRVNYLK